MTSPGQLVQANSVSIMGESDFPYGPLDKYRKGIQLLGQNKMMEIKEQLGEYEKNANLRGGVQRLGGGRVSGENEDECNSHSPRKSADAKNVNPWTKK